MARTVAEHVTRTLSAERFAPYLAASGHAPERALRLYAWNIEMSAAFHGPLHVLEVSLRNALHNQLTSLCGRPDWWHSPAIGLDVTSAMKVDAAKRVVAALHVTPTPGHIVAELSFGFWGTLLSGKHTYEMRLWRPALHRAFPAYHGPRRPLYQDLYHLRRLRNRIAHHEPIHQRHLTADYDSILRILGYISPKTAEWVKVNERVSEVLGRRGGVCAAMVPTRF
ncbi:hypothetical protein Misp01_80210 [Microtetraspora sp. NBRC 13810]|uniref:hypothetical protein n=1 Tax=Microtetraspora sp. NBRC 13810 TaxID=3030990 RepID=UPI0024A359A9|nr:hypothetical protein [Microtetraspora sp. NBRC 13810]GLW12893.1 hypothetical protein Misp01_80210 [Microtetraspora sp. NBRC 13810]